MSNNVSLDQLGSDATVQIGDRSYVISPIRLSDLKTIKARIRSNWLASLNSSGIDPRAHKGLRTELLSKPVTMETLLEELESPDMWPLMLHLSAVQNDPTATEQAFATALNKMGATEIEALREAMAHAMGGGGEDGEPDFTPNSSELTGPTQSPASCTPSTE